MKGKYGGGFVNHFSEVYLCCPNCFERFKMGADKCKCCNQTVNLYNSIFVNKNEWKSKYNIRQRKLKLQKLF